MNWKIWLNETNSEQLVRWRRQRKRGIGIYLLVYTLAFTLFAVICSLVYDLIFFVKLSHMTLHISKFLEVMNSLLWGGPFLGLFSWIKSESDYLNTLSAHNPESQRRRYGLFRVVMMFAFVVGGFRLFCDSLFRYRLQHRPIDESLFTGGLSCAAVFGLCGLMAWASQKKSVAPDDIPEQIPEAL